ncbi:TonB-dependent receptor [Hyphomonas sp. FCG-A18]|uniref:TonB-dependent receptor domain-containing protein n=1 Tax=Hyphomonas sp. FCG-A18 TaxID=3080019 RepID=UPI002B2827C6|nr:TonB-dependent receptor [Hyphomonas sp. FCG-A18]
MKSKTKLANRLLLSAALPLTLLTGAALAQEGDPAASEEVVAPPEETELVSLEDDASDEAAAVQDKVIVTGSRIRRSEVTNISPTVSVGAAEFDARGAVNVLDLLEEIPALTGSESIDDNQFSFGDSGVRRANLRGLGAFRSLTVVDNRRRAPTASSFFGRNSFDWNVLPQNMIERVDVLTGGASSIYGSDAVSGVINIILKDEMDGYEFGAVGSTFESGGYSNWSAYATGGWEGDRWNAIASVEYSGNSEYSTFEAGREGFRSWVPNEQPRLSWPHIDRVEQVIDPSAYYDSIPYYNVLDIWNQPFENVIPSFGTPWPFRGYHALDANGDVVLDENGNPDFPRWVFGERVPGEGEDWFIDGVGNPLVYDRGMGRFRAIDLGAGGLLNFWGCDATDGCEMRDQMYDTTYWSPTTRFNAYTKGTYALTDSIDLSAELIYAKTEAKSDIAPQLIRRNNNIFANKFLDTVDLTQPLAGDADLPTITGFGLNPLFTPALHNQLDALGETSFQIATYRLNDLGTRESTREQDYLALAFELDGELQNGWEWDATLDYGYAEYGTRTTGQAYGARFDNALDVVIDEATGQAVCRSAEARAAGCSPANLLDGLSVEAVDYIRAPDATFDFTSEMLQLTATLSGDSEDFFTLPAGPVSFATGLEWRYVENDRKLDEATVAGEGFAGSQLPDFSADNTVKEAFVEVVVPILADVPGARVLDFEGAYRLSEYEKGGSDILDTYKYGVRWAPVEGFTVRAIQARSIRAPHPSELSLPGSIGFIGYTDPCGTFSLSNNPDRVDDCLAWTGFTQAELDAFTGLNTGQDQTGGNPNLVPEVSDTLTIGFVLQPTFLDNFWLTVDYFDIEFENLIDQLGEQRILNECADRFSVDSQFCQLVDRDPVTREIQLVRDTFVNVNGTDIDGWDMQAGYRFGVQDALGGLQNLVGLVTTEDKSDRDLGEINLTFSGQYLEKDEFINIDGAVTDRAGGTFNPDVRLRGSLGYSYKDFRFFWSTNYIGATDTDASEPRWETNDIFYHDASISYYFDRGNDKWARLSAGINNVFDEGTRPHTWTYGGSQFDRLGGRGYYLSFSVPLGG